MERVLDATIPYHPVLDVLRCLVVLLGAVIVVYAAKEAPRHRWRRTHSHTEMAWVSAAGGVGLLIILQQLQQLGDPAVWWRFPLLAFVAVNGAIAVRGLTRPGGPPSP
jgi:cytochrome bd-type quinol oxidase subunit 2